jgi:cellulose synthase/poly-beta-1,6-N-acetylglucosamine synthase-like glycosyltransferase
MTIIAPPASNLNDREEVHGLDREPLLSLVVPVYKEERSIRPFLARAVPVLERLGSYEILFCLDPSPDRTEQIIREEITRNAHIGLLVLSRRFRQPMLHEADVLDPVKLSLAMRGCDVVFHLAANAEATKRSARWLVSTDRSGTRNPATIFGDWVMSLSSPAVRGAT